MAVNRVNYSGVALFVGNHKGNYQIDRASAFGSSGTITTEDVFELGQAGIVEIVDENTEYSMTIDANEYGTPRTLGLLADKDPEDVSGIEVDFSKDFDDCKIDIINYISDNNNHLYTQFFKDSYITGYTGNYVVDGNSTESFTLASDNKTWYLNGLVYFGYAKLTFSGGKWEKQSIAGATLVKALTVYVNGKEVEFVDESDADDLIVDVPGTTGIEDVYCRFVSDSGVNPEVVKFTPNTVDPGAKRRGHIELYLVKGHSPFGKGTGKITGGTPSKQFRVQSVSVDVSLDRENLAQLGSTRYYARPLNKPLNVTTSFDLTFSDLDMFAYFAGKDVAVAKEMRPDDFLKDVGAIIRIYDKRDIDDVQAAVKEIHIPYLIPTDEAFNVSLDGNATQTFSFRSHELYMTSISE